MNVISPENKRPKRDLKRNLSNRHIQFIAISGAIGTGLFMGSGKTISLAGPSILLVYMIIGFVLFFVMRAMGEILLSNLNYKSFSDFANDLLGPWAGFFTGWTYWFCWVITGIADVVAIAGYTQYWFPDLQSWIPMLLTVILLLTLNLLTVKMFGEIEFWFSLIKIIAIIALIAVGLVLIFTAYHSETTGFNAAFSNIWEFGGLFPHGMLGFFAGFQIAIFAFVGIELVGTTAAETEDPTKNLPRAINSVPVRIIFFYLFALIIIMSVTPWSSISPNKSPFVELFTLIGLPAAASIINFVVLTSAASSANSGIYSTSRMLFGLAKKHDAPEQFGILSRRSIPANGLLFSCLCLLGGVILIYLVPNVMDAFTIVTTISAILFMFIWSMILISYIAFRRKKADLHRSSHFKMPGGVIMSLLCLAFFIFIIVLLTLEADTRNALIATPIWFIILGVSYYFHSSRQEK
ncbi:D-serine/D-alanine/glycine transporter [Orbaceae bacterium ESL0721]|nr:D-serine/D-alanine/glycine transporter [Orbaceae bacterium ESL0721]